MINIGTANEKGTIVISCAFFDESGNSVVPTEIKWTLIDKDSVVINNLEQVVFSTPAASVDIVLSGDDLAMQDGETERYARRFFVLEAKYDSSIGTNLPLKDQAMFLIENLKYIV